MNNKNSHNQGRSPNVVKVIIPQITSRIILVQHSLVLLLGAEMSARRAYSGSEFVVANTLAKWKKLEPIEIKFSQGFSQKVVSTSCFVFNS